MPSRSGGPAPLPRVDGHLWPRAQCLGEREVQVRWPGTSRQFCTMRKGFMLWPISSSGRCHHPESHECFPRHRASDRLLYAGSATRRGAPGHAPRAATAPRRPAHSGPDGGAQGTRAAWVTRGAAGRPPAPPRPQARGRKGPGRGRIAEPATGLARVSDTACPQLTQTSVDRASTATTPARRPIVRLWRRRRTTRCAPPPHAERPRVRPPSSYR
jgi:hypothetical protein